MNPAPPVMKMCPARSNHSAVKGANIRVGAGGRQTADGAAIPRAGPRGPGRGGARHRLGLHAPGLAGRLLGWNAQDAYRWSGTSPGNRSELRHQRADGEELLIAASLVVLGAIAVIGHRGNHQVPHALVAEAAHAARDEPGLQRDLVPRAVQDGSVPLDGEMGPGREGAVYPLAGIAARVPAGVLDVVAHGGDPPRPQHGDPAAPRRRREPGPSLT